MEYPLVTAIMLSYNQAGFAVECLESIKAQNYPNLELIVNDDASRDDSVAVIRSWLEQSGLRHQLLVSDKNQGICRSMNRALANAKGKYVAGIAADDAWLPGKLLGQVALMERLPEKVAVAYSDALQMDEHGKTLPLKFIEAHRQFETPPQGDIHRILWEGNFIPAMSTMVRRSAYQEIGPFDESLFYEDWDMWLRMSRDRDFAWYDQPTARYRIVSTSIVRSQTGRLLDAMCQMCIKHLRQDLVRHEARHAAKSQLQQKALLSFNCRSARHRRNLLQAMRLAPSPRVAARCAFACCGLGHGTFEQLRSLVLGSRAQAST